VLSTSHNKVSGFCNMGQWLRSLGICGQGRDLCCRERWGTGWRGGS